MCHTHTLTPTYTHTCTCAHIYKTHTHTHTHVHLKHMYTHIHIYTKHTHIHIHTKHTHIGLVYSVNNIRTHIFGLESQGSTRFGYSSSNLYSMASHYRVTGFEDAIWQCLNSLCNGILLCPRTVRPFLDEVPITGKRLKQETSWCSSSCVRLIQY